MDVGYILIILIATLILSPIPISLAVLTIRLKMRWELTQSVCHMLNKTTDSDLIDSLALRANPDRRWCQERDEDNE